MLPLVGQKLALQDKNLGTSLMSACIVAAQLVMVPVAMLVGAQGRPLGPQALLPRRARDPADSRRALHAVGQSGVAGRRAAARRHRRRHFRRDLSGHRRRSHAQHRPLQRRAGRRHHRARHRRGALDCARRPRRGEGRLQRRLPDARRRCGDRALSCFCSAFPESAAIRRRPRRASPLQRSRIAAE